MIRKRTFALLSVTAVVVSTALPATAARTDKKTCIASSESGQKLRHDGKLRAAREQLLVCARQECPAIVRQDCAQFLNEVATSTPSVVIAARDSSGKETLNVKVSIDGEQVMTRLDGKAFEVDPGVHVFKYEADDGTTVQEEVGIRQGEKNRVLYVSFRKAEPETPAPSTAPAPAAAPPPAATPAPPQAAPVLTTTTKGPIPAGAYLFGGIGLVGIGAGAFLIASAGSDASHLRETCAPSCPHSDVSAARNKALLGDIALAVGGVSLVAAMYIVLSRPSTERVVQTGRVRVDVAPLPGGAAMGLSGAF